MEENSSQESQKIWTFTTFITNIYTIYVGAKKNRILVKLNNFGGYTIHTRT
jgi:hypothetical protein